MGWSPLNQQKDNGVQIKACGVNRINKKTTESRSKLVESIESKKRQRSPDQSLWSPLNQQKDNGVQIKACGVNRINKKTTESRSKCVESIESTKRQRSPDQSLWSQ